MKIKITHFFGLMVCVALFAGVAQAQKLQATFKAPSIVAEGDSYNVSDVRWVEFGIFAEPAKVFGYVPNGIAVETGHTVTEGVCRSLSLQSQQLECEQSIWARGVRITLPAGNYTAEIRPLERLRVVQMFFNAQFLNCIPNGTLYAGQDVYGNLEYNHAVLIFGARVSKNNWGISIGDEKFEGVAIYTWQNAESFGFAHGLDGTPVQIYPGMETNMVPNYDEVGNVVGFQTPHSWVKTAPGYRDGNRPVYLKAIVKPSAPMLVNFGVLAVEREYKKPVYAGSTR